jgi:hypothetical protein
MQLRVAGQGHGSVGLGTIGTDVGIALTLDGDAREWG